MPADDPFDGAVWPDEMEIIVCADRRIRIQWEGVGCRASWSESLVQPEDDGA